MNVAPATIRAALAARLQGVADIGAVHDYERYATNKADLAALYESAGELRGWFIRRTGRGETTSGALRAVTNRWQIRGYMSLNDAGASELTFDALVESAVRAFDDDHDLGIGDLTIWFQDNAGVQVDDMGPVLFAGVLCHSARLSLATRHYYVDPTGGDTGQ